MKTLRKFLSLVLSFSIATYALPGLAYTASSEADAIIKVELTDEAMSQAVGAGAVDATMADPAPGALAASAVFANRSIVSCGYSMNIVTANNEVIATLASGSLAPDTATVVKRNDPAIRNIFVQAKISCDAIPGLLSLDTSTAW